MPVQIGSQNHSFSDPTGLLSDCHRRIEMFLGTLERVSEIIGSPLETEARTALETALRYFREAAPKHTADEERSLFPRLREMQRPDVDAAIKALEPLERDHRQADSLHAEVDGLGNQCLREGSLPPSEAARFRLAVAALIAIYREHIRVEDEVVFPVASRFLSGAEKAAIANEMASRRS